MRAELFSVGQLERHARTMAGWHELIPGHRAPTHDDWLLARLQENEVALDEAYALIATAVQNQRQITPAAEWFLDNFHLIEEQIRTARRHLPRNYSRELPRLANGPVAGTPRVYHLALELISHSHGRVDDDGLRAFVAAYQAIQPLCLGELWAIPIMLRLALIENLRRVVAAVVAGRRDREAAAGWVAKMSAATSDSPTDVVRILANLIAADPPLTTAFVAEMVTRLQAEGASLAFALGWLEHRLAETGRTVESMFERAGQSQAADQVAIGNSIGSLRYLGATDWRDFVEAISLVEATLRTDPSYPLMDFATRDRYRHVVERLARHSRLTEDEVARHAVRLAAAGVDRTAHVGYYLIDRGLRTLAAVVGVRRSPIRFARAIVTRLRGPIYGGAILALGSLVTLLLAWLSPIALTPAWIGLLALCASEVAIGLVHAAATLVVAPTILPRLDFSAGIPEAHRTLVAVPAMLGSIDEIDELVEALEVRFLANRDPNLGFALVTDFRDAEAEVTEGDDALVAHATAAIEALDTKYANHGGFFLLHRARTWNPRERAWMGWERKRGKLEDLNALLRGELAKFATRIGPMERLLDVRYVIALDADTGLPRDAARELAGTLAHPLNRPRYDAARGRVVEGYTILQPRLSASMASIGRSRFARLFGGRAGIDPYTRAVSDVYQDLFGEGSFVGKGIYDVDAMRQALAGKLPDNRVLSHDLLESAYARSALVSDVLLVEDFPATHAADIARRHRWTRGDWQIIAWLFRRVPAPGGRASNPISGLSQWKVLDNLRRSVIPIAFVTLLGIGWACGAGWFASCAIVGITLVPTAFGTLVALARRPEDQPRAAYLRMVATELGDQLARDAFALSCLPFDAMQAADAIGRALVRVFITRRRLLEWRTARDAERAALARLARLRHAFAVMWAGPVIALGAGFGLIARGDVVPAVPFLVAWLFGPAWSWLASRPRSQELPRLAERDRAFLRMLARRTWRFFEAHVVEAEHYLPPDNLQEDPPRGIAHRTSPTNIGLALLANLTAYDFGYVTAGDLIARTTNTLATLDRLERFRGHFFNWYDTLTLAPLLPRYVSTVDSGNLAGHLLTLAAGLEEIALADGPPSLAGLPDTLAILEGLAPTWPEVVREVTRLHAELAIIPTDVPASLARLATGATALVAVLDARGVAEPRWWAQAFADHVDRLRAELAARAEPEALATRAAALRALAIRCRALAEIDYELLYDRRRHLMSIGYAVSERRLDASDYDLLASEARLASFIAIAQGKLPQEHWFSLGRQLTSTGGRPALLSWSGSMFEYLMPALVMPSYPGTLLDATCRAVVERQIAYGRERGVPWGVSESGYQKLDAQLDYQYRAFGVPGLGFKRGLADDLVIAPYACALALVVDPRAATANLHRLIEVAPLGPYGLHEAIDYTVGRVPADPGYAVVASYMAHHQGMAFLAIAYVLLDRPMQRRFSATPEFRATELLLQERVPRAQAIFPHPAEVSTPGPTVAGDNALRVVPTPNTAIPEVHLLSNGRYHVMVSAAGGGYSRWRELAVTRWQEDATRDCWGSFGYLRDIASGATWSVAHQPTRAVATRYEAIFSQGRAEVRRTDHEIDTHVEISISPEDDIELRRISLTNRSKTTRTIEITSYAEVVIATPGADAAHPAFSNLFVQTELLRDLQAIACTRRPRSGGEKPPWMFHLAAVHGKTTGATSYETSRAAFVGRGRSTADPIALTRDDLGNSEGAVLDPIVAIRNRVVLAPDETARIHIVTGMAETREVALGLVEKYRDRHAADRVFELSWTHSQVLQRRLEASSIETQVWERLASHVLFATPAMRGPASLLVRNRAGQAGLWAYGISGDLPIVLVRIVDVAAIELVRQVVKAHTYWRLKGLVADVVIWNEDPSGYRQVLHEEIMAVIASAGDANLLDKPGGVFVRRSEQIAEDDKVLMQTVARVIVSGTAGSLAEQLERARERAVADRVKLRATATVPMTVRAPEPAAVTVTPRADLVDWNGHGGFTADGREYVIRTTRASRTPAPWCNVLANPWFGTVISESGGAYTWCENAHENRLTPWHNDAVGDTSGEAFYLRDEESGTAWSPTPLPMTAAAPYTSRHGFGYSVFEVEQDGIASELRTFVATDAPIKFVQLTLRNRGNRTRRIAVTGVFDLVLGATRSVSAPYVVTELDRSGGVFARNAYSTEFAARVAFLDCSEDNRTVTGDRQEILGRNGSAASPAFLGRPRLSGRLGAGLDPCVAMQVVVELREGEEREIAFTFGSGRDLADARHLVGRFRGTEAARVALEAVWAYWNHTLGAVNVQTPDHAVNILANGWLVYQVLACRLWARSGFYQSGGAFGFRDQLQDAMALVHAEPALLREQIVRVAGRQFPEGDVQHWWHPPLGRGVRTHISDDFLWLPYAVCRYVATLGDTGILDDKVAFLVGRPVKVDEDSYYDLPGRADEVATVYEHCVRAVKHGLRFGARGLPLMGGGAWNDGMNLVGVHGRGESVWLGFFLYDVLQQFGALARARGDVGTAEMCATEAGKLRANLEAHGWDGDWYRRAYFDDGAMLGSAENTECRIDSLPQSWAVLSKAGDPARATKGLAAADKHLVRRDLALVQLLDPPFDTSALEPGYIKGYVPGVRENGGQYTHAAVWLAMAFAAAGQTAKAWEVFGLVNPLHHGDSEAAIATYKVEPYVMAADVYTNPAHAGRGGWTWYTGAAGWMYRLITESLLGIHLEVDHLRVEPKLPADWPGLAMHYRHRETVYHIQITNRGGAGASVSRVSCDGVDQPDKRIPLRDDRVEHRVEIDLG